VASMTSKLKSKAEDTKKPPLRKWVGREQMRGCLLGMLRRHPQYPSPLAPQQLTHYTAGPPLIRDAPGRSGIQIERRIRYHTVTPKTAGMEHRQCWGCWK